MFSLVEHRGEELAVLGDLDAFAARCDDVDAVFLEAERELNRRSARRTAQSPPRPLPP